MSTQGIKGCPSASTLTCDVFSKLTINAAPQRASARRTVGRTHFVRPAPLQFVDELPAANGASGLRNSLRASTPPT
jgi:hypothetical protein